MTTYTHIESPLGQLLLTSRDGKLSGLYFADQAHARIGRDWVQDDEGEIFAQTAQQLEEYASGERENFDLPISMSGTPFQLAVWNGIANIPFGQTVTYSELAQQIGRSSNDARAVGTATGLNPVSWIVPCHRVVGKSGADTGYAGGIARKNALLEFEGAKSVGWEAILAHGDMQPALALA
jgi:methylated-DNA-[protein]-cysteine S-methyltransferase